MMMEAVRTSETSVDNHFTRQYIPEDNSEQHLRFIRQCVSRCGSVVPTSEVRMAFMFVLWIVRPCHGSGR
jgi:hypothetical protein